MATSAPNPGGSLARHPGRIVMPTDERDLIVQNKYIARIEKTHYMDAVNEIDKQIVGILQNDSRTSNAQLGQQTGLSVSAAGERVRRLATSGAITAWRAVLDPAQMGYGLCAFVLVDMDYNGEEEAKRAIAALPEVQEMHHISGAHSYLLKIRVKDTADMQRVLQQHIKPLGGVQRTESIVVLETVKETTVLPITSSAPIED